MDGDEIEKETHCGLGKWAWTARGNAKPEIFWYAPSCRDDDVSLKFVKRSVLVVGLISRQNEENNMIS